MAGGGGTNLPLPGPPARAGQLQPVSLGPRDELLDDLLRRIVVRGKTTGMGRARTKRPPATTARRWPPLLPRMATAQPARPHSSRSVRVTPDRACATEAAVGRSCPST